MGADSVNHANNSRTDFVISGTSTTSNPTVQATAQRRGHRCTQNTPIYATASGVVEGIGYEARGYGHYIVLSHPKAGYKTLYAHLNSEPRIPRGAKVVRGEQIGLSGNSGLSAAPHLHYEVCLLYTSPSPRDRTRSRMPSSA